MTSGERRRYDRKMQEKEIMDEAKHSERDLADAVD